MKEDPEMMLVPSDDDLWGLIEAERLTYDRLRVDVSGLLAPMSSAYPLTSHEQACLEDYLRATRALAVARKQRVVRRMVAWNSEHPEQNTPSGTVADRPVLD